MEFLWRIDSLPVIAVELKEPSDAECIDETSGTMRMIITRPYMPVHGPCIVMSISGTKLEREAIIGLMSVKYDDPIEEYENDMPYWVVTWKSPSTDIPDSTLRLELGGEVIDQICKECGVSADNKRLVDEMVALSGYFAIRHSEEKLYLDYLFKKNGVALPDQNSVLSALHQINMSYIEKKTGSRPPG